MSPAIDVIKLRGGTAAQWTAINPVLAPREPGLETDTGKTKYGDGVTAWISLAYSSDAAGAASTAQAAAIAAAASDATTKVAAEATARAAAITALVNAAPGALDTLKELADALGDDASFATTITNALALKAPLASPALTGSPLINGTAAASRTGSRPVGQGELVLSVKDYGAVGDGTTDDTTAIQNCLTAAGSLGAAVYLPPVASCYRVSGLTVPHGVTKIVGHAVLDRTHYNRGDTSPSALYGSVLAPISGAVSTLLTVGANASGTPTLTNPHGLIVHGIGFLGTTAAGSCIANMWGCIVQDTSDVTFAHTRSLYCDSFVAAASGGPSGGPSSGTGGFVQVLSSGSGNGFSENCRLFFHQSLGDGKILSADGNSAGNGGSTDGCIFRLQANGHNRGVQLGPANAGCGGWDIIQSHFSSTNALNHINYGSAGTPWTLRVVGSYFDVSTGNQIISNGRGLQALGNYFRYGANTIAINFGAGISTNGRDPAAVVEGNTFDLNGSVTATCAIRIQGFTAANVALHAGGVFRSNLCHNHGAAMPGTWVGPILGSDNASVSATTTATLDLSVGAVLSA